MDKKYSTLHEPIRCKDFTAVRTMISQGVDVNEVETSNGITPLHLAAGRGNPELVQLLIKAGANLDAKSSHGMAPVHEAVISRNGPILKLLVDAGADVSVKSKSGKTLMEYALQNKNHEIAEILVDAKAKQTRVGKGATKAIDWRKVCPSPKDDSDAKKQVESGHEEVDEPSQDDQIIEMLRDIKRELAEMQAELKKILEEKRVKKGKKTSR